MLSIRVSSLLIHGDIFDHIEMSTEYDFIFGCNIAFQFVKEDFRSKEGGIKKAYISVINIYLLLSLTNINVMPHKKYQAILGGDFNMVENLTMDRQEGNPNRQHQYGLKELNKIII